jgi:hypothetical protein
MFYLKGNNGTAGQALVESLFSLVVLTAAFFAAVQFCLIAYAWLRANDAAFSGVRCAVVCKRNAAQGGEADQPQTAATRAALYVLGTGLPAQVTLYDKDPLGAAGTDLSGNAKKAFSVHVYYRQKLMFSSFLQPIAGGWGRGNPLLSTSRRYGPSGAAQCRMVKSPDWRFYCRAFPGANLYEE